MPTPNKFLQRLEEHSKILKKRSAEERGRVQQGRYSAGRGFQPRFTLNDRGELESTDVAGGYGFSGFWGEHSDLGAGIDVGYDWRSLADRPAISEGSGPIALPGERAVAAFGKRRARRAAAEEDVPAVGAYRTAGRPGARRKVTTVASGSTGRRGALPKGTEFSPERLGI